MDPEILYPPVSCSNRNHKDVEKNLWFLILCTQMLSQPPDKT